jgi:hypothetical protein
MDQMLYGLGLEDSASLAFIRSDGSLLLPMKDTELQPEYPAEPGRLWCVVR